MSNPFKKAGAQGEAAVQAINTPTLKQTMLQYKASPLSLVLRILVTAGSCSPWRCCCFWWPTS